MSRRQRTAVVQVRRMRVARAKVLRRRARGAGARRAVAAAAALGLAGTGSLAVLGAPVSATAAALAACSDPHTPSSNPNDLAALGDELFFVADDGIRGPELWKTDGTTSGTVLVKDIHPGGPARYQYDDPTYLTAVGSTLFFTADDGVHGRELWKSDGTRSGTVMVRDIDTQDVGYDSNGYGEPWDLTAVGDTLFFTADDHVHGRELWKSDGTRAGTVQVADITPGRGGEYDQGPGYLVGMGGSVFFTADDHTHGRELWTSDAAGTGATMVRDISPGEYDSEPTALTVAGDKLFFFAGDGTHGRELWVSGGDESSTHLVEDVQPGVRTEGPSSLTAVGDTVFFDPDDGVHDGPTLWRSDGTEAGTAFVADVDPFAGEEEYLSSVRPVAAGGSLFFVADDPAHGLELWSSDGSEAGTAIVKDIRPGSYGSYASYLVESGGKVFLTARDGTHGPEVWVSDGTAPGTSLTKNVNPGVGNRPPTWLTDVGGTLFFAEGDGVHGVELWKTDGTAAATLLVKDVNLGGGFTIAKTGVPNTSTGTMRVKVTVKGAGRLVVGPVGTSPLRTSAQDVPSAGAVTVTLRPTDAGMRTLRRNGSLRVSARFTFTPCGGSGTSQVRTFTLHLG